MQAMVLPAEARHARIRQARDCFVDGGVLSADVLASVSKWVTRSWERCRALGLDCRGDVPALTMASGSTLREARERSAFLLGQSRGLLAHLYEQIRATGSVVLLADSTGLLIDSLGDTEFVDRANRVALQPGACWSEVQRGTNAIGLAMNDLAPIEVVGSEHFFDCNGFLTCSAAPIFDAQDRLLGVLDISADFRSYQRHTLGLARMTTALLEKRIFEAEYAQYALVSVHREIEYVGTLQEGLLAFSPDGRVMACNRPGMQMLGLNRHQVTRLDFDMVFEGAFGAFIDRISGDPQTLLALNTRHGEKIYAQVKLPAGMRSGARKPVERVMPARRGVSASKPVTGFAHLDTGDPNFGMAISRASRIVGRDIPLLILGESGVGKEMFAQAYHAAGPRHDAAFVALNCAAIPENLIESELFGYVGGAFTGARREGYVGKIQQASGGTLFLDEIGDMPLSLQARLLRVLQERTVMPLGGTRGVPVDITLVCATHRNLPEAVKAGEFRQDLYYRVNGLP